MQLRLQKHSSINSHQQNEDFLEDLQEALLDSQKRKICGIDQFEKVYRKKKLINQTIDSCRLQNQGYRQNIKKAKQRIYQIQQLNQRAIKQSILMKNQMEKINDAHMMSKILMMQKIVKLQKQADDFQQKKSRCFRIRSQKHKAMMRNKVYENRVGERKRQMSLLQNNVLKEFIEQRRQQNYQHKRQLVQKIRDDKSRLKSRAKKIQEFKLERARKNYIQKSQIIKNQIALKQKHFYDIYHNEKVQQRLLETTQKITKQYLQGIFPTETI